MLAPTIALLLALSTASQQAPVTAAEEAGIRADIAQHLGDAPQDPGPMAHLSPGLDGASVRAAMRRVGDWELKQGEPWFNRQWTSSALYAGYMAAAAALPEPSYTAAMQAVGSRYHWELRSPLPNADDQSVAQMYLTLYLQQHDAQVLAPTRSTLDALLAHGPIPVPPGQADIAWWWCDALFMAPPVWARLYTATHRAEYLSYLETNWWLTSTLLYDPSRHLFYRDQKWLHRPGPDGQPVFWSRGNGWVMAGLVRTYEFLPAHDPDRARMAGQLQAMAAAVVRLQDPRDGMWHANLLDAKDYPQPEVSGTALITYALAWGVEHGLLPRKTYLPAIRRAWTGMTGQIYADGRLGNIQQTGDSPAHYLPSSSYDYGVGGFLLAGSAILQLHAR